MTKSNERAMGARPSITESLNAQYRDQQRYIRSIYQDIERAEGKISEAEARLAELRSVLEKLDAFDGEMD
ncbi:MAG: hypothetical protein AAGF20_00265 [Pseudomonadota bacterium]